MYPGCINRLRNEPREVLLAILAGEIDTDECHFSAATYLLAELDQDKVVESPQQGDMAP